MTVCAGLLVKAISETPVQVCSHQHRLNVQSVQVQWLNANTLPGLKRLPLQVQYMHQITDEDQQLIGE